MLTPPIRTPRHLPQAKLPPRKRLFVASSHISTTRLYSLNSDYLTSLYPSQYHSATPHSYHIFNKNSRSVLYTISKNEPVENCDSPINVLNTTYTETARFPRPSASPSPEISAGLTVRQAENCLSLDYIARPSSTPCTSVRASSCCRATVPSGSSSPNLTVVPRAAFRLPIVGFSRTQPSCCSKTSASPSTSMHYHRRDRATNSGPNANDPTRTASTRQAAE
ncbi:hypothetical protein EJ02DRAFT_130404 [Clathrospora elynae]|uniref:Uncharacterized protein n=1 Tax=Clathrospora elynae TaxID=706981 RepID=A0A6A5SV17_9PLEO|nr:hypothetical protein EJ02DRAFT_130404 [Clathrospora elynae]